jgi:hypothetical protein
MSTTLSYEIGNHEEYSSTPIVYRVVSVDGVVVSRDLASKEEIVANSDINTAYLTILSEHLINKADGVFDTESIANVDYYDLVELYNCVVYILQKLATLPATENIVE